MKVGIEGQDDAARPADVRRTMGSSMGVRIDAHEAGSTAQAIQAHHRLKPIGLDWVEHTFPS